MKMTIATRKKPLHHWLLVIVTGCAMSAFVYAQSPGAKPVVPQANPLEQQAGELQKALADSERKAADARAAAEAQRRRADEAEQRVREALKTKPAPQAAGINPAELQAARREAEQERALRQQAEVRVTAANERIAQLVKEVAALQGRLAAAQARSAAVAQAPQVTQAPQALAPAVPAAWRLGLLDKPCAGCPELLVMPWGRTFVMGGDGYPQRNITINHKFAVGKYEVTQDEWRALMADTKEASPSAFKACGGKCPVEQVSWDMIKMFLERLNAKAKLQDPKYQYRLPTEAEWEYAARAGSTFRYSFGNDESQLEKHAWFGSKGGNTTHDVGLKDANAWGLHDMHGNVWEWVQDCYVADYKGAPVDGSAYETSGKCAYRVLRGGSWNDYAQVVRAAIRNFSSPDNRYIYIGFRIARTLF